MIVKHSRIAGRTALIECSIFGKFSAVVHFRNGDRTIESKSFISQNDAIHHCKMYGFDIPFGF